MSQSRSTRYDDVRAMADRSLRDATLALLSRYGRLADAPGFDWYQSEHDMLASTCAETDVPVWRGAAYIGASSINTGPEHGRRWVFARLRGDFRIGHVPAAMSAWNRITSAKDWYEARESLTVKSSRAFKVKSFACNINTAGRHCEHERSCVTVDRHMYRLATYDTIKAVPTGTIYRAIADALLMLADEYDVTPSQLQAVLWVALADRDKSVRCIKADNGTWVTI